MNELTPEEETRLLALLGVGPKPRPHEFGDYYTGDADYVIACATWDRLHDEGALIRWVKAKGWSYMLLGGGGDAAAIYTTPKRAGMFEGTGPNPRAALARACLAATEET